MTERELSHLYSTEYGGQKGIHSPTDERPVAQSSIIRETGHFGEGTSGLTIMEMGCADGWVLYNLRKLAGKGGRLVCFEADLDYAEDPARLAATFEMAKKDTEGLSTEVHKSLFDPAKIAEKSVDVFTSSHVIEHLADPCTFLNGLHTVMKPGGIIFTEVPDQHMDPVQGRTRGQFHLLYFAKDSFVNMMTAAGFEQLELAPKELGTQGGTIRTVFRVPYAAAEARVPNAVAQVLNSAKARNVYLDLGANWANTLRLYRDFYPEKKNEPWEVYAFEASPFIQPYDEKFIQYLNGHGSQPPLTVPPAGSSDHLRMYAAKYGCNTEHFRECMWAAFEKPLGELKFDPQLNKTELINQRLAEAATASHGTRYTFVPAAVAAQDGVVHLGEMSAEQMIRGGAHSSGEGVHSGKQVDVYGVDVATFITKYFDKGDNVFVKMDVEGLEFAILQKLMDNGGIQIIDKLVMECHAGAGDCKKLIRSVKAAGVDLGFEGEHGYKGFDSLSSPDVYSPAAPATL
jgi:2-polyprenyl-3-methyl-5-hydroxy-6-metoxy-1,4-benzoquinol methylase